MKIFSEILNLCHNSYKKIVDELSTEKEQIKLCEWWRLFLGLFSKNLVSIFKKTVAFCFPFR